MNKASEWAARYKEMQAIQSQRPVFVIGEASKAMVTDLGECRLWAGDISAQDALALARWMLDTFGGDDA